MNNKNLGNALVKKCGELVFCLRSVVHSCKSLNIPGHIAPIQSLGLFAFIYRTGV